MTKEVPDIVNSILDHGGPLQAQAPSNHIHISRQAHGLEHFRPKHAAVAHLYPLAQLLRVSAGNQTSVCNRAAAHSTSQQAATLALLMLKLM